MVDYVPAPEIKENCRLHNKIFTGYDFYCQRAASRVEDGRGSVWPRFPSPLIKPDMRSYRIRLSDWLHLKAHGV